VTRKRKVELLSGRIERNERKSLEEILMLNKVQSNKHTYFLQSFISLIIWLGAFKNSFLTIAINLSTVEY